MEITETKTRGLKPSEFRLSRSGLDFGDESQHATICITYSLASLDDMALLIENLTKALEPFAKRSRTLHSGYDAGITAGDNPYVSVPVKDLRAAEAALNQVHELRSNRLTNARDPDTHC